MSINLDIIFWSYVLSCDLGWLSGCLCKWNTITGGILGNYLLFLWLDVMFFGRISFEVDIFKEIYLLNIFGEHFWQIPGWIYLQVE